MPRTHWTAILAVLAVVGLLVAAPAGATLVSGLGTDHRSAATSQSLTTNGPIPISSCTAITEPGKYVLIQDLAANGSTEACIQIDVNGTVVIDGQGHDIEGSIDAEAVEARHSENTRLTLEISDVTVDDIRYPRGDFTGPRATGRLDNVTVETITMAYISNLTIESSHVENDVTAAYALDVIIRNSTFEGTLEIHENARRFEIVGNEFQKRVIFHEYLLGGRIAENRFNSSLEFFNAGGRLGDVIVSDNRFTVDASDVAGQEEGAIVFVGGVGSQILNNDITVTGSAGDGREGSNGVFMVGKRTTIAGNTITGADNALWLFSSNGRIVDNRLVGNDVGIRLGGSTDRILHNTISDNRVGVEVVRNVGPAFEYNDLSGNREFAVLNSFEGDFRNPDGFDFDARNNYWGASDGPSSAPASDPDAPFTDPVTGAPADGAGGAVSEGLTAGVSNVQFDPFLTEAPTGSGDRDRFYQVDFVVTPIISEFGPADSDQFYSDQGRLIWFLHGSTETPVERTGRPSTTASEIQDCIRLDDFSVVGDVVTVQYTVRAGCDVGTIALVVYEKPTAEWSRATASEQRFVDASTRFGRNPTDVDSTRHVAVTLPTGEYLVSSEHVRFPRTVDPRVI